MFQFPGFAPFENGDWLTPAGLPHSAIRGSLRVCHSPRLIAAYHGLPRLRVPRHPPHAFARLTTTICDQATHVRSWFAGSAFTVAPSKNLQRNFNDAS